MHKTHFPLSTWFWAMYLCAIDKRGISAKQLATQLELSYESAWYLLKRIRFAMKKRDERYFLSNLIELVVGFCTIVCGGEDFTDMETMGIEKAKWLRTFLALPNGIPDSDTFRRVFEKVNPQELSEVLRDWLDFHRETRSVVSIDGKTICGSSGSGHKAYHVVSAFVAENRITLGEIATEEKSSEITAVPELLDILPLKGSIITADAMSCQTKIVAKISKKEADYVIGLKGNQTTLLNDVSLYF